jgi:stage V sporulation protein SpoVS
VLWSRPRFTALCIGEVKFKLGRRSTEILVIGTGTFNQAIKAIVITKGFLAPAAINLICIPAFQDIAIAGMEKRR